MTVARWEGVRRWVETVKGLRSTNWLLQNSHGNVKYSIGDTVNNIVITVVSDGYEIYQDDHLFI